MNRITAIFCAICCSIFGAAYAQFDNVHKGDIIDINGLKAIVFCVDGEGHGSAMYVGALRGRNDAWCADKKSANKVPTYSESSGKDNMQAVLDYVQANDVELSQFPAFDWCNTLGEGWYIPSVKEMETFVNFILGNDQEFDWDSEDEFVMDSDNLTTKELNARIHEAGGIPFIQSTAGTIMTMGTYTSTKTNGNKVYVYEMNPGKNVWRFKKVAPAALGKYTVGRAFYDF
jgi:outer membrane protein assembly factor BamB